MDIFGAVAVGIAVEPVLDTVAQAPDPTATHNPVDFSAVFHQKAQQRGEVWGGPVTGNKAFGKANVPGLQCAGKCIPVVQMQGGVGQGVAAKTLHASIGKMHRQASVAQTLQKF